ncbi:piwi domain-containing protein [Rhizophagus clarus]|uniref:Piwi domain-containing protein n=1 Tax=Rhizophagus clarus TaxID=94130 RepID=A0A8H3L5G0_9GLOM|nr:piwi domain-containing protein [Rhizophagus clarus]
MEEPAFKITQFVKRPDFVTISPVVPRRLNWRIFNHLVDKYQEAFGDSRPVFDGKTNMYAHTKLPFGDIYNFEVELEEDAPVVRGRPLRKFKVRLIRKQEIVLEELFRFLRARGSRTNDCHMAITAMDIIISHKISTKYPTVGRSFYVQPQRTYPLSGGLEAWRGYFQSARPTVSGKMMINVDLTATAFYEKCPLVEMVAKILGKRSPNDLRRGLSVNDRHKVEDIIRGLKIKDNHRRGSGRKFRIEGLTETPASHTMFDRGDGSTIDVKTYFYDTYNLRLIFPFLPCVTVRRGIKFPIEVCEVLPEQRYIRKLNGKQTKEMIKFARQNPSLRANMINEGLNILNYRNNEYLRQFGMDISNDMAVVKARVLPTPTIQYQSSFEPENGAWDLRNKRLATGATLGSWSVLVFLNEDDLPDGVIEVFMREFVNTCQYTGLNVPNKHPPLSRANPIGNIEESLKLAWLKAGNTAKANPQLILCVLPEIVKELYAEIKRVGETIIGVATQCIQHEHMFKPNKQYCANVCLKMNVKLGGMNSFLRNIPFVGEMPTILIGADVSHPGPGENESPSYAGLCGSMDARASRYAASIRVQGGRDEIINDLANMVKELLKAFYQTCGSKPQRILFYRDGVSENQFEHVLKKEINAIRAACQALDDRYRPTITFVVVQKRHHTRFFPIEKKYTDRSGNCLPGTVIDSDITHPFEFDFFLQSHAGIIGTSRPAHYHVLFDENGFNADKLQILSYYLCYIYARCTRAVSLVPPVYYAHLVTARARLYSRQGVVKPELQRVMYFM